MKISIVATHSFPIPYPNLHTGDIVILNLAKSLQRLGHEVKLFAPEGTDFNNLYPMRASFGKYPPSSEECETECFNNYKDILLDSDIVHDFSNTKRIIVNLNHLGYFNTLSTILGGAWKHNYAPRNLCVWSKAHRQRVLKGETDYVNTLTPDLAGPNGRPVEDCHTVYGGIDTSFYTPKYDKSDYHLWLGRWHPVRGYKMAIDLAKKTKLNVVLAGEHPDNELFQNQKDYCKEAMELAKGHSNIDFYFLPPDPDHHFHKIKLYQEAKSFLYTVQFHEPFGLSQVESLACGTPVIATNYGSCPEIINHGSTGFICENNVDSFADALYKVNKISPELCRKNAVQRFDQHVMAKSYLKEYQAILDGKSW